MDISRKNGRSGMTLIEILIVIMLLGVLAGVLVKSLSGTAEAGKQAAANLGCETIKTALMAYKTVKGQWPADKATLVNSGFIENDTFINPWGNGNGYAFNNGVDGTVQIRVAYSDIPAPEFADITGANGAAYTLHPSGKLEPKPAAPH
ncbi:MAG: type II secretion system GspH family protein [Puniceicoccales bacterium]|jgi:prepilin-type N-terminal cleavage/methylation domain-containing protein|nr:type II secretion system GspH family protein [Puniceicoccales bacterium]